MGFIRLSSCLKTSLKYFWLPVPSRAYLTASRSRISAISRAVYVTGVSSGCKVELVTMGVGGSGRLRTELLIEKVSFMPMWGDGREIEEGGVSKKGRSAEELCSEVACKLELSDDRQNASSQTFPSSALTLRASRSACSLSLLVLGVG